MTWWVGAGEGARHRQPGPCADHPLRNVCQEVQQSLKLEVSQEGMEEGCVDSAPLGSSGGEDSDSVEEEVPAELSVTGEPGEASRESPEPFLQAAAVSPAAGKSYSQAADSLIVLESKANSPGKSRPLLAL